MSCLGIDIGGANVKYATCRGHTHAVEFPLWKRPDDLCRQLVDDLKRFGNQDQIGITMTGELADCFLDREIGVRHIAEHAVRACARAGLCEPGFYAVDGKFYRKEEAFGRVDEIAASNWHALASFVGREFCAEGLVIDIGSTTSDLIPIRDQIPSTSSKTDYDRLVEGSLVYLGGERTPVCSLANELSLRGKTVPVIREVFATMQDVRVLLGFEDEDAADRSTADGKPRDRFHAGNRMARSIGLDHRSVTIEDAVEMAAQVHAGGQRLIEIAVEKLDPLRRLVTSGHAVDLIPASLAFEEVTDLHAELGPLISRSATAYAIARLVQNA